MNNLKTDKEIFRPKVLYFISGNGSDFVNTVLATQYLDADTCQRKELLVVDGKKVSVYQINRDIMHLIRNNSSIKNKVTFYTQSTEAFLKEMNFPKPDLISRMVKKAA